MAPTTEAEKAGIPKPCQSDTSKTGPSDVLQGQADRIGLSVSEREFALRLDENDPLRNFRDLFSYPKAKDLPGVDHSLITEDEDCVYMVGHSLGLMPKCTPDHLQTDMNLWAKIGHLARLEIGEDSWESCDTVLQEPMSRLVGAKPDEIVIMNTLTVNLHLFMISFYQPTSQRHKILLEGKAFPSDHYIVESQICLHGYHPKDSMIVLNPRQGEHCLRTEDILRVIQDEGDSIALILFPGIQYFTGQLFDMEAITKAGHEKGCFVGFDCAHAAGNVELKLHDWDVDFACWCTYKYMNAGHGSIGACFLHEKHAKNDFPKLLGWWGHKGETRFDMTNEMDLSPGAAGYRLSSTSIFPCSLLRASLTGIFSKTSMKEIRAKSVLLTSYLELLLNNFNDKHANGIKINIITPSDPEQRGAQLSISLNIAVAGLYKELSKRGVLVDMREPNILRLAPCPLYTSFLDVYRCVQYIKEAIGIVTDQITNHRHS